MVNDCWWNRMKLTSKDKEFMETLKGLLAQHAAQVQLKESGYPRMALCTPYASRTERAFRLTRQGVRWRFDRVFNDVYVSAYETILFIERHFGTELRTAAMRVAKHRFEVWKKAQSLRCAGGSRR